jgi:hypothetical protein
VRFKTSSALTSDTTCSYADTLESGLEAEIENGRVARIMTKLGFINERPEYVYAAVILCE